MLVDGCMEVHGIICVCHPTWRPKVPMIISLLKDLPRAWSGRCILCLIYRAGTDAQGPVMMHHRNNDHRKGQGWNRAGDWVHSGF